MQEEEQNEKPKKKKGSKIIKPLKNFIFDHNGRTYILEEGKEIEIPEIFLANLLTEKVIK